MNNSLEKPILILASDCDDSGRLGVRNLFEWFMDLAAEHAVRLGVGYFAMLERGCCWVAVRTRIRVYRRPPMGQTVRAETWPGKPGLAKSDRFYRVWSGDELLAEGRTEWAVQDLSTGAVRRTDSYGWPDITVREDRACADAFTRFGRLTEGESFSYTVSSMDIDVGHHMNNVAYIRMLLSTFSTAELSDMDIREAEISYRRTCLEGEPLTIRRLRQGDAWLFQAEKADGETAVQALFRYHDEERGPAD